MFKSWNRNRRCFDSPDTLPWVRIKMLSAIARLLGVQFHYEGVPFGGSARKWQYEKTAAEIAGVRG